jgi:hypothetical protein
MMNDLAELPFELRERARQVAFFDRALPNRQHYRGAAYRLVADERGLNLAPGIREAIIAYFGDRITWHTHANHALSSQVCCLNFLAPLASDKDRLSVLVGRALGIAAPEMMAVETDLDGRDWFVGFEWNGGGTDFLNESRDGKPLKRGSNSTSTDAMVKFRHRGQTELLLIEWKYTEKYGAPISPAGNKTRTDRYAKLVFSPDGPIKSDQGLSLADFFYEPFYQLLRQQMLAFQLQKSPQHRVSRVRVLHISPSGNRALHRVTSPSLRCLGDDAFEVFRKVLVQPGDFIGWSTEALFGPLLDAAPPDDPWASYLKTRYGFLADRTDGKG